MSRLFHTGALMVDLVLEVPHVPPRGGDTFATSYRAEVGGGFNVLAAAARDGLPGVFAGRTGSGPYADLILQALRAEGVEVFHDAETDVDNGFCVALVDEGAERTFITSTGAEEQLRAEDLALLPVGDHDFVYVSGYALASPTRRSAFVDWVPSLAPGPRVVLDTSPLVGEVDMATLADVLARTSVLSCNAREGLILAEKLGASPMGDLPAALDVLRRSVPGSCAVVLRDGWRGTWLFDVDAAEPQHIPALEVVAVDSNGAGDAHTGVLMSALAAGASMADAVVRANVAAGLAVTRRGPATAPSHSEIERAVLQYLGSAS